MKPILPPLAATALLSEILTLLCQTIAMRVGPGGPTRPVAAYIVARPGGIGRAASRMRRLGRGTNSPEWGPGTGCAREP